MAIDRGTSGIVTIATLSSSPPLSVKEARIGSLTFALNFQRPDERVDTSGKTIRALNDPNSERAWSQVTAVLVQQVALGQVPIIAQPSSMVCWAAVFTMMLSWRQGRSLPIRDAMAAVGTRWVTMFDNNQPLLWIDTEAFGEAAGMTIIPLQSLPVMGFADVIRQARGPLFVSIHPQGNRQNLTHLIVVTGITGDGTPAGTNIMYNDLSGGVRRTRSFQTFHQMYENSARTTLSVQIMHF